MEDGLRWFGELAKNSHRRWCRSTAERGCDAAGVTDDGWSESHIGDYDSPDARLAGDLAAAECDLEDVVSALDRLRETGDTDPLARAAYYTLAVSLYARLFAKGRRHRIDHLLEEVFRRGPAAARDVHRDVLGYRDQHLAHALSDLDQAGVRVEVQTRPNQFRRMHRAWAGSAYAVSGPAVSHFRDLADALRQVIAMERDEVLNRIDAELAAMTLEELQALPVSRSVGENSMQVNGWRTERRTMAPRPPRRPR